MATSIFAARLKVIHGPAGRRARGSKDRSVQRTAAIVPSTRIVRRTSVRLPARSRPLTWNVYRPAGTKTPARVLPVHAVFQLVPFENDQARTDVPAALRISHDARERLRGRPGERERVVVAIAVGREVAA